MTTSIGEIVGVQKKLGQAASDTVDVAKAIERASLTVSETAEKLSESRIPESSIETLVAYGGIIKHAVAIHPAAGRRRR